MICTSPSETGSSVSVETNSYLPEASGGASLAFFEVATAGCVAALTGCASRELVEELEFVEELELEFVEAFEFVAGAFEPVAEAFEFVPEAREFVDGLVFGLNELAAALRSVSGVLRKIKFWRMSAPPPSGVRSILVQLRPESEPSSASA